MTEILSDTACGFIPPRRHSEGWGLQSFTRDRYGYRFRTLAPSSLSVLHGFLSDTAGGTTRPAEGFYPRSTCSMPDTSLSENSRLPSWTWIDPGAFLPITRASRTLGSFTLQGRKQLSWPSLLQGFPRSTALVWTTPSCGSGPLQGSSAVDDGHPVRDVLPS